MSLINTVWNENSFQILFITLKSQKRWKNAVLLSFITDFIAEMLFHSINGKICDKYVYKVARLKTYLNY